jgi:hypothetical protein
LEQDVVDDDAVDEVVNDEDNYISPALEAWLKQEAADLDNADEGSVVIMARVQFFTGHMHDYAGMPAVSALDTHTWYGTGHQLRTTKRQKRSLACLCRRLRQVGRKKIDADKAREKNNHLPRPVSILSSDHHTSCPRSPATFSSPPSR